MKPLQFLREKYPTQGWRAIKSGMTWTYENNVGDRGCYYAGMPDENEYRYSIQFLIHDKDYKHKETVFELYRIGVYP